MPINFKLIYQFLAYYFLIIIIIKKSRYKSGAASLVLRWYSRFK